MALVNIHLGGKLGTDCGKLWRLDLARPSVAEAVRAVDTNLKGKLRELLYTQGYSKYYKVAIGRKTNLLGKDDLAMPTGAQDIYIMPTVKGKSSGWGKIIAAVVIAVATYFTFGTSGAFAIAGYSAAASLAIGGIVQLLTPTPNFNQNSQGDSRGSNIFQGNGTTISQGGAVGLVYGRALVIPMPISISYDNTDEIIAADGSVSIPITPVTGPGNIIQYPQPGNQILFPP